jgi:hypothetical protein
MVRGFSHRYCTIVEAVVERPVVVEVRKMNRILPLANVVAHYSVSLFTEVVVDVEVVEVDVHVEVVEVDVAAEVEVDESVVPGLRGSGAPILDVHNM